MGVPRILQWKGFTGVDPGIFEKGVSGFTSKAPAEGLGDEFP